MEQSKHYCRRLISLLLCFVFLFSAFTGINISVSANTITNTLVVNDQYTAYISSGGGYKYYSFVPEKTDSYSFYSTGSYDTYGYIYDSNWSTLYSNDDAGTGNNFHITCELIEGNTYYFGVRFYSSSATGSFAFSLVDRVTVAYVFPGAESGPASHTADYTSSTTISTVVPERSGYDFIGWSTSQSATAAEYLPGDTYSGTDDLTLYAVWLNKLYIGVTTNVEITRNGQMVYYSFTPTYSTTYTIYSSCSADTKVYLYDENYTQITYDDDGGDNYNFYLSYSLTAGVKYIYGIRFYSNSYTGTIPVYFDCNCSHSSFSTTQTVSPTCTDPGYSVRKCLTCSYEDRYNQVSANGHTEIIDPAVAPTCNQTGLTEGSHCSVCGVVIVSQEVLPTITHDLSSGYCSGCGTYLQSAHPYSNSYDNTWTIEQSGARYIAITFSSDTQTESGCDTITICDGNNNTIGTYSGTELAGQRIAVYDDTIKIKLHTDGSVTRYGFRLTNVEVSYSQCYHSGGGAYVSSVSANCETTGYTTYRCYTCGALYNDDYDYSGEHSYYYSYTVNRTCESDGYDVYYCSYCGDTFLTNYNYSYGHEYYIYNVISPTCTTGGYTTYKCYNCSDSYRGNYTPATGHDYYKYSVIKPTCASQGYTLYKCYDCGNTYKDNYTAKLTKHTYSTSVTKKATSKSNGNLKNTCKVCKKVVNKPIYKIKTVKLSGTSYIYNGKVKTPSVVVKDSKGQNISKSYYTVSYSKGRKAIGKYDVKITFKGRYSGTFTRTFTIKPKATKITKLTTGAKKFRMQWSKVSGVGAYQVQYSTSSKFTASTTKTVSGINPKSYYGTVINLKSKKKYYVRIRTYKNATYKGKKTTIYSSWSPVKSVKTK